MIIDYSKKLEDLIPKNFYIGLNYHTTWQSEKGMRFILLAISGNGKKGLLGTRASHKVFWTELSQLRNTRKNDARGL